MNAEPRKLTRNDVAALMGVSPSTVVRREQAGVLRAEVVDGVHVYGSPPFAGSWALPGGYVEMTETLDEAARRELEEETGLSGIDLRQLHAFGALDRHPTERVVSVAYYALVKRGEHAPRAASDARRVAWFPVDELPPLAFDHAAMLELALTRVRDAGEAR